MNLDFSLVNSHISELLGCQTRVQRRLTGGAASISLLAKCDHAEYESVVIRLRPQLREGSQSLSSPRETAVVRAVAHLCAPKVLAEIDHPELGTGMVTSFVQGETIPRKVFQLLGDRDPKDLGMLCGRILAQIHATQPPSFLYQTSARDQLELVDQNYRQYQVNIPMFDYALLHLEKTVPTSTELVFCHGDFRMGNIMFDVAESATISAVLDWELAHCGMRESDMGWLCTNSWRFGNQHLKAGGFAILEDVCAGYKEESGIELDANAVAWWTQFGSLRWGSMALGMGMSMDASSGSPNSIEHAMVGRRVSETCADLAGMLL